MSTRSRARRVQRRLPWRSNQALLQHPQTIRPADEETFVAEALDSDVPKLSFVDVVKWAGHFAKTRADEENRPGVDALTMNTLTIEDLEPSQPELHLQAFLGALDSLTLMRVQTHYYFGRDDEADPAVVHSELRGRTRDREDAISTMLDKAHLDQYWTTGLAKLTSMSRDPNGPWHRRPLRDFICTPVAWMPIRETGRATFRELTEVFSEHRDVPLAGKADPEMGPYSACVVVPEDEVSECCAKGYRKLTQHEDDEVQGEVEDLTESWNHSE